MITLQERVHGVKPPQDWPLSKLHHVFTVRKNNKNMGMLNDNLLSLSYGRIINKDIDTTEGLLPESFETYQIVYPGDIILRLTDLQNDKRSIRQGLVKEKGIITSAYDAVYPAKGHDPRYWAYTLLALDLAKYYYSMGGGVRQSIKFKDFPNDWLHAPSYDKQKEIADFLDHETVRIDQLIKKKEDLLSCCQEKVSSEIAEKIVSSTHKMLPLRRHIESIINGATDTQIDHSDHCLMVTRIETISGGKINYEKVGYVSSSSNLDRYRLKKHDLLFSHINSMAMIGNSAIYEDEQPLYLGMNLLRLRVKNDHCPRFIWYCLRSPQAKSQINQYAKPAINQASLSTTNLKRIIIPTPDQNIQKNIAMDLDLIIRQISLVKEETIDSINKLESLKRSLITEAVTGQLDIHAWQKRDTGSHRLEKVEQNISEGARAAC